MTFFSPVRCWRQKVDGDKKLPAWTVDEPLEEIGVTDTHGCGDVDRCFVLEQQLNDFDVITSAGDMQGRHPVLQPNNTSLIYACSPSMAIDCTLSTG